MTIFYTTFDLCLATTLSLWIPIENLDKTRGSKKVLFIFKDSDELQKLLKDYWSGRIQTEPKRFFGQLKILKGMIHSNE